MPWKPRSNCSVPGCPRHAIGHGKCHEHAMLDRREYDEQRPSRHERGYGAEWEKIRNEFLKAFPCCFVCGEPATDVDHIVPRSRGGTDTWPNLQSLCHRHHSQKTAKYDGRWRKRTVAE